MHCENSRSPACRTTAAWPSTCSLGRRRVKLDPSTQPKDVAALADAHHCYHAVRKALPLLYPGTSAVVIGAAGSATSASSASPR
jgi:NAD+-dependent secondary alcohol dehydrogenase Adh1